MAITLGNRRIATSCHECTDTFRGAFEQVGDLLRQRRRRFADLTLRGLYLLMIPLGFMPLGLVLVTDDNPLVLAAGPILLALTIAWVSWLFGFQRGVILARRSQLGRPA